MPTERLTVLVHTEDATATVHIDLHHRGSHNEPVPGGYVPPEFDLYEVRGFLQWDVTRPPGQRLRYETLEDEEELDEWKAAYFEEITEAIDAELNRQEGTDAYQD